MNNTYKEQLLSFYQSRKRMPTYSEMMDLFGFKSKNAVYRLVTKMIAVGLVTKDSLGKLIPSDLFNSIPMLGLIKAGLPAPGEVLTDTINIEEYLVQKKESTYMFEVDGDSMIDAHIESGDMVIAERKDNAKDGDIVIALIDGEYTMKYLRKKGDSTWLEAANKNYAPLYPREEMKIVAVVKGVIRKY